MAPATDVFRALADPTRRALLDRLLEAEKTVNELARPFRVSQPAISQHLGVLRAAGLVRVRRHGRERFYRLDARPLRTVEQWSARFRRVRDPFGHLWTMVSAREEATRVARRRKPREAGEG
jgi:DNA-binding transcriptional ArsR family regulator